MSAKQPTIPAQPWTEAPGGRYLWDSARRVYRCQRQDGRSHEFRERQSALAFLAQEARNG